MSIMMIISKIFIFLEVNLRYLLLLLLASALFLPITSYSNEFNGSLILNKIIKKLEHEGFNSNPSVDLNKYYPLCDQELSINKMFGSWRTIQVKCSGSKKWKLAVRTNINQMGMIQKNRRTENNSGKIKVLALNKTVRKNKILHKEDLIYVDANNSLGGDIFVNIETLVGRTTKSHLNKGTVIRARHLQPNWIVTKNQLVSIEHKIGNIIIKASGIAQQHGQLGEKILVNNTSSGKKVWGWIENGKKIRTYAKIN